VKTRTGFVSNSSSSSFLVFSKANTLFDALYDGYEEIFEIPKEDKSSSELFCEKMKEFWPYHLSNGEYNHFWFEEKDQYGNYKENTIEKISTVEEYKKYVDDFVREEVVTLFKDGWNCFSLDVPDGGDGGTVLQNISRGFVHPLVGKKIVIMLGD
jgi:hypothetical protein